ncbi:RhoGAP-domain-containing protein [Piromyces finnis]|uniref:RhoGAP-domain-containing protein n=1 Tax=Piromyces finnis TaxID=1754191 RepID=A0A1Y1VI81_9FUNG|nr:RhoGAP-domain-containing protein [Piromyces finnis]|eukprot:ORX56094.1 RhoGAP-domain-containing protein [Piromyces finnis]
METQDPIACPLNNAEIASLMTKGTGTISGMSLKKTKHKKTKSVSGPEIFNLPDEEKNISCHRRSRSSRAPTSTSIGSINISQIKQNIYPSVNQVSSSTTLNQSTKSIEDNNMYNKSNENNGIIDLNVLNDNNVTEKKNTQSSESEWIIQALCEIENGFQVILDRVKQNTNSCKDAIAFLKKRAIIEEEYGKAMLKLCQTTFENTGKEKIFNKQGSYNDSWNQFIELHEKIGNNRLKFAESIGTVTDNLFTLLKNTERSRKQLKEAGLKHQKAVIDSESLLEKAKIKYETCSEAWEEAILEKERQFVEHYGNVSMSNQVNGYNTIRKKSLFSKNTVNPTKLQKNEDETRNKAAQANEAFKVQLISTNTIRREFFRNNLPRILKSLKEANDECDNTLQYNLGKYSLDYENALMSDATTISPLNEAQGLRKIIQKIDNAGDFIEYVRKPLFKGTKFEKNDIPFSEYKMQPETYSIIHPKTIFGVSLSEQLARDNTEIPEILNKCAYFIERYGLNTVGVYRLSGSNSAIQKLRTQFDRDASQVVLAEDSNVQDTLNNVTGVLKLYFRELPDSLFTQELYNEFIEASKTDDDRKRLVEIHELVNRLPDPNYLTLRYLIAHLDRVSANQKVNKMGISNLSIIWGPTLFGSCSSTKSDGPEADQFIDMKYQCKVVEVILSNCYAIFDPDS